MAMDMEKKRRTHQRRIEKVRQRSGQHVSADASRLAVPRVRVAAVIVEKEHLLLVRHQKQGRTYWLLPGGGAEFGESLESALMRELKEETNLDIKVGHLIIVNDSIPPDRHRHVVNMCFTAQIAGGEMKLGNEKRLIEARFVPLKRLPELTFYPDIRHVLLPSIRNGFPNHAAYLGNLWKDD